MVIGPSVRSTSQQFRSWGSQSILDHVAVGEVFGETYACLGGEPLMVDAAAAYETEILFLRIRKLLTEAPENDRTAKETPSGGYARRRLLTFHKNHFHLHPEFRNAEE